MKLLRDANNFRKSGDLSEAIEAYHEAIAIQPHEWRAHHALGLCLIENCNWTDALESFKRAEQIEPKEISITRRKADTLMALTRIDEAILLSEKIIQQSKTLNRRDHQRVSEAYFFAGRYAESADAIANYANYWRKQNNGMGRLGVPVVVAALPKSGSTSVTTALAATTGSIETEILCRRGPKFFGSNILIHRALRHAKNFKITEHSHLEPNAANLAALKTHKDVKVCLHVRDPREALISAVDMLIRNRAPQFMLRSKELYDAPLNIKIDWMIENYLPCQINWISDWLEIADISNSPVKSVTDFSELKRNGQNKLAKKIANRLGIECVSNIDSKPRRFNLKKLSGWRDHFSKEQQEKVESQIPIELFRRFNWGEENL